MKTRIHKLLLAISLASTSAAHADLYHVGDAVLNVSAFDCLQNYRLYSLSWTSLPPPRAPYTSVYFEMYKRSPSASSWSVSQPPGYTNQSLVPNMCMHATGNHWWRMQIKATGPNGITEVSWITEQVRTYASTPCDGGPQ